MSTQRPLGHARELPQLVNLLQQSQELAGYLLQTLRQVLPFPLCYLLLMSPWNQVRNEALKVHHDSCTRVDLLI
jgi:hypothetical protein